MTDDERDAFNAGVRAAAALAKRYGYTKTQQSDIEIAVLTLLRPEAAPAPEPVALGPAFETHRGPMEFAPVCTATGPMSACPNRE